MVKKKKKNDSYSVNICQRLFNLFMNSLTAQALKRVTLGQRPAPKLNGEAREKSHNSFSKSEAQKSWNRKNNKSQDIGFVYTEPNQIPVIRLTGSNKIITDKDNALVEVNTNEKFDKYIQRKKEELKSVS